ncbi:MAG: DUF2007 domain-containing protein [Acetobacteraceae bacterium]|nr:DUF2007 domain-containing protein [Acetobacteraceae bacterium]
MRIIAEESCPIRAGFLLALLRDAGIAAELLDAHWSALTPGVFPLRLAVRTEDEIRARRILTEAGEG